MKKAIKLGAIALFVGTTMSSCFLFKGGGHSGGGTCPAYGSQMENSNEAPQLIDIKSNDVSM